VGVAELLEGNSKNMVFVSKKVLQRPCAQTEFGHEEKARLSSIARFLFGFELEIKIATNLHEQFRKSLIILKFHSDILFEFVE